MSPAFTKLRAKLADLFQLDAAAELDFGIYRILNARRAEIARFLDSLEVQVETILGQAGADAGAPLRAELAKTIADLQALAVDDHVIDSNKKVKELRDKLAALGTAGQEAGALRDDIFSLLTTFFSRYYKDGDFLSLRRYKADTYAIPYEGEEVKLHWANADQFYIKSAENFRDYTFRLGPPPIGDAPDLRPRVTFKLTEADTEKDNNKPAAGKERRFIFHSVLAPEPAADGAPHLTLGFTYAPAAKDQKQADLNADASARILTECAKGPFLELAAKRPTEKKKDRTLLDKHLADYTARNTFDYFVHKDLGGFLRRELDFFIKNEVVHLDDLDDAPEPSWTALRARLKALRAIAHKVIRFLAQIEDFQKKLWLKKKFVTACDYVVTLDRLPEDLYPAIAVCDAQREEWVRLMAIDEIKGDLGRTGYSKPLTVEFLKENRSLSVDTRWFSGSPTRQFIAQVAGTSIDGFVAKAENSNGLRFLGRKYHGGIPSIYIDPPYNTSASEIIYKNSFLHSTWLTMIEQGLLEARKYLSPKGAICVTIDDAEVSRLTHLLDQTFGDSNRLGTVPIRNNPQGRSTLKGFRITHEYGLFYASSDAFKTVGRLGRSEKQEQRYDQVDEEGERYVWENFRKTGTDSQRQDRLKQFYPIYVSEGLARIPLMEWDDESERWEAKEKPLANETVVWPVDDHSTERVWKWGVDRVKSNPGYIKSVVRGNETQVMCRNYPDMSGTLPGTWWGDARYAAGSHGTNLLSEMFTSDRLFAFPKSIFAVTDSLQVLNLKDGDTILDFFAGSGTTGHAVINLNREDGGNRRLHFGGDGRALRHRAGAALEESDLRQGLERRETRQPGQRGEPLLQSPAAGELRGHPEQPASAPQPGAADHLGRAGPDPPGRRRGLPPGLHAGSGKRRQRQPPQHRRLHGSLELHPGRGHRHRRRDPPGKRGPGGNLQLAPRPHRHQPGPQRRRPLGGRHQPPGRKSPHPLAETHRPRRRGQPRPERLVPKTQSQRPRRRIRPDLRQRRPPPRQPPPPRPNLESPPHRRGIPPTDVRRLIPFTLTGNNFHHFPLSPQASCCK